MSLLTASLADRTILLELVLAVGVSGLLETMCKIVCRLRDSPIFESVWIVVYCAHHSVWYDTVDLLCPESVVLQLQKSS